LRASVFYERSSAFRIPPRRNPENGTICGWLDHIVIVPHAQIASSYFRKMKELLAMTSL